MACEQKQNGWKDRQDGETDDATDDNTPSA